MALSATISPGTLQAARPPRLAFASFESRIAAATLDLLVLFIIAALLVTGGSMFVLASSDFAEVDPSDFSIWVFYACVGAIGPAAILYYLISYAWKGQTVGKAVMQLVVLRSDGHHLGLLGAISRVIGGLVYVLFLSIGLLGAYVLRDRLLYAAVAVGAALVVSLVGLFWAVFDSRRRALHDRLAGTIVVRLQ